MHYSYVWWVIIIYDHICMWLFAGVIVMILLFNLLFQNVLFLKTGVHLLKKSYTVPLALGVAYHGGCVHSHLCCIDLLVCQGEIIFYSEARFTYRWVNEHKYLASTSANWLAGVMARCQDNRSIICLADKYNHSIHKEPLPNFIYVKSTYLRLLCRLHADTSEITFLSVNG